MALRSLTNSPVRPSQSDRETEFSDASEFPVSSNNSSGVFPILSVDDGIYNAQRVASDREMSMLDHHFLGPVYQSNHDRAGSVDVRMREKQTLSEGNAPTIDRPSLHNSLMEVRADGHCRGWSLNDLDCATRMHTLFQNASFHRSPSSNEALEAAANVTTYPHLPPRPPPCRRSTPDGIPSFGSKEAQELRLVAPSRLYRLTNFIQRQFQSREPAENVPHNAADTQNIEQPRHPAPGRPLLEGPAEVLRRASGMVRPVHVTGGSRKVHRAALPKGVRLASAPGDLTVAEDGSYVSGRFGNRVSGHGVGQRTMDLHPLVRGQESSMIEEEVRAINKACEREDLREGHLPGYVLRTARDNWTMEASTVAQAIENGRRAICALEEQRRQNSELRAALRTHRAPSPASCSHNSSSTIYHSTRASRTSNLRSSSSETIRPPRMTEPASYDGVHLRRTTAQDSMLVRSTIEEALEGQEHDQAFHDARRRENQKSDNEIC